MPEHFEASRTADEGRRLHGADADHPDRGEFSFVQEDAPLGLLARRYMDLILAGDRMRAGDLVEDALDAPEAEQRRRYGDAVTLKALYLQVFQPALYEIGRLWQHNAISVAQEHYFTAATQLVMSRLYPRIFTHERKPLTMVAACADDELHEVGMRMVADFFEMHGWDTYYLGANMPAAAVLQTVTERAPDVLALSVTMSYHLDAVAKLIAQVRQQDAAGRTRVIVGGYCFRAFPDLWRQVGADGSASDAGGAVALAESLTQARDRNAAV